MHKFVCIVTASAESFLSHVQPHVFKEEKPKELTTQQLADVTEVTKEQLVKAAGAADYLQQLAAAVATAAAGYQTAVDKPAAAAAGNKLLTAVDRLHELAFVSSRVSENLKLVKLFTEEQQLTKELTKEPKATLSTIIEEAVTKAVLLLRTKTKKAAKIFGRRLAKNEASNEEFLRNKFAKITESLEQIEKVITDADGLAERAGAATKKFNVKADPTTKLEEIKKWSGRVLSRIQKMDWPSLVNNNVEDLDKIADQVEDNVEDNQNYK